MTKALTKAPGGRAPTVLPGSAEPGPPTAPAKAVPARPKAVRATARSERTRVERQQKADWSPTLDGWVEAHGLAPLLRSVRGGQFGLDRSPSTMFSQLEALDAGQRKALRDALLFQPPHRELRRLKASPAVVGPPTAEALLEILSGAVFGASQAWSERSEGRMVRTLVEAGLVPPAQAAAWTTYVFLNEPVRGALVGDPVAGFAAVAHLRPDVLREFSDRPWVRRSLVRLIDAEPARAPEVEQHFLAHGGGSRGADALHGVLSDLDLSDSFGVRTELAERLAIALYRSFPLEVLGAVGRTIRSELPGTECLLHERGVDGLVALVKAEGPAALRVAVEEARGRHLIVGEGFARTVLDRGASWPPPLPPGSRARAEAQLRRELDLPAAPALLSGAERARLVDAMKATVQARSPELYAQLERELAGRRFIPHDIYQALYEQGVANPELYHSAPTFASWRRAAEWIDEAARAGRDRPPREGELLEVLKQAHALSCAGVVEVQESHLTAAQLGVLRGPGDPSPACRTAVKPEQVETVRANPHLAEVRELFRDPAKDLVYLELRFPAGDQVPDQLAAIDAWYRSHEGRIAPAAFAAELHHRLVSVHAPFDGAGRTAKLLVDFALARASLTPTIYTERNPFALRPSWPSVIERGLGCYAEVVERYLAAAESLSEKPN